MGHGSCHRTRMLFGDAKKSLTSLIGAQDGVAVAAAQATRSRSCSSADSLNSYRIAASVCWDKEKFTLTPVLSANFPVAKAETRSRAHDTSGGMNVLGGSTETNDLHSR